MGDKREMRLTIKSSSSVFTYFHSVIIIAETIEVYPPIMRNKVKINIADQSLLV